MNPSLEGTQLPSLQQLMASSFAQLQAINENLLASVRQQEHILSTLEEVRGLLNGFTNGGASFGAYQCDPFTTAYLSVLGPMIAMRLGGELQNKLIPELLKAGAPLARDILEELAAYRQQQFGRDALENAMSSVRDPWAEKAVPESGGWEDLSESS